MDTAVIDLTKKLETALRKQGIRVNRIILYGSQASGKAKEHSDIDVAVISDDFKGMNILERLEIIGLALAKARIMEPIEPLGYTEEEFSSKGKGTFIGDEIKAKGIEIK
ncbi:MAG: nucleotidyltransferase domain-containing protein [Chloroflexi bacterium]|nr:nucleotidyltransferase domain-containing protein [Chloroflexota bacterium]